MPKRRPSIRVTFLDHYSTKATNDKNWLKAHPGTLWDVLVLDCNKQSEDDFTLVVDNLHWRATGHGGWAANPAGSCRFSILKSTIRSIERLK